MMNYCLGRSAHDPAAFAATPAHIFGVTPPPEVVDRRGIDYRVNLYDNDTKNDCVIVALANFARGVAALNGFGLDIRQTDVDAAFGAVGGTTNLAAIPGLVALDAIKWQAANGFRITGNQALVAQVGRVALNTYGLKHAIDRLGGVYMGVALYEADMDAFGAGRRWTNAGPRGKRVGGHMINGWDYDRSGPRVGTWGTLQPADWDWLIDRLDEAYAPVWRQLAKADGTFYNGLTADGLVAEATA